MKRFINNGLMKGYMELTELFWDHELARYQIVRWDNGKLLEQELEPSMIVEAIGGGSLILGGRRTKSRFVRDVCEEFLFGNEATAYGRINAFSLDASLPIPDDAILNGQFVISFYHVKKF